ncbi:MAG: dihydrolipoamide acetyltransferase family protein [Kiritimatiellia bacterium]
MAQAVVMPKLGQTVEEATVVKWHRKEGDRVKKGEVLFEIETDKAVLEAESFYEGTLLKIFVGEEKTVPVSSVVAYIGEPGEKVPEAPPVTKDGRRTTDDGRSRKQERKEGTAARGPGSAQREEIAGNVPPPVSHSGTAPTSASSAQPPRLFISPRARALAKTSAIDPSPITGSGPNGRIIETDVVNYLREKGYDSMKITPAARKKAIREEIDILNVRGTGESGRIRSVDIDRAIAEKPRKMSRMRRVTAERLTHSFTTTPHFYVTVKVDMTALMRYRQQLKKQGYSFTVTDFILRAVVLALREFPALNSSTDGEAVRWRSSVDLGLATAVEEGLVVPVIRNADELTMEELHSRARELAGKAREGKLLPDEMKGSSFTVSNMGMLDVENFAAIINPGESGILAVASTVEEVVPVKGKPAVKQKMKMTLSVDHRIVDGKTGAEFTNSIKNRLEDIKLWKNTI